MFTLYKVLKAFILPPSLLWVGFVVGVVLLYGKRARMGRIVILCMVVTYYLLSIGPTAYVLSYGLERQTFYAAREYEGAPRAIVILGGGASKEEGVRSIEELSEASWRRLWRGVEVYRAYNGHVPIMYAGGSGDPFDPISNEADLARRYAVAFGIPVEKFLAENVSRDTYENVIAVKRMLNDLMPVGVDAENEWVALVTSARHMPRAMGVMKKTGITAVAYPADFFPGNIRLTTLSFIPSSDYFYYSVLALNEWIGMVGYRLRGRI